MITFLIIHPDRFLPVQPRILNRHAQVCRIQSIHLKDNENHSGGRTDSLPPRQVPAGVLWNFVII
jgi:hypothetical protein